MDFNCAAPQNASANQIPHSDTLRGDCKGTKNKCWANKPALIRGHWAHPVLAATELSRGFPGETPIPPRFLHKIFLSGFSLYPSFWSSPFLPFTSFSLTWLSYSLSRSLSMLSVSLPPSLPLCHSAHLGCLLGLGTSVPVRGAQWGPVEDTKGGLLQLPVTLRPTQQLLRVYSSVLNPHAQPYHKGTSLAPAQRGPPAHPVLSNTAIRPTNSVISVDNMHV